MAQSPTTQHHLNLASLLKTLGHISQVLAAITPIVVAPLAAAGTVDAETAAVINSEASAASQILAAVVPQSDPATLGS
jgi:hypothetical protein